MKMTVNSTGLYFIIKIARKIWKITFSNLSLIWTTQVYRNPVRLTSRVPSFLLRWHCGAAVAEAVGSPGCGSPRRRWRSDFHRWPRPPQPKHECEHRSTYLPCWGLPPACVDAVPARCGAVPARWPLFRCSGFGSIPDVGKRAWEQNWVR